MTARGLRRFSLICLLLPSVFCPSASASIEEGIPVASELVRSACAACHETDAAHRMSRISYGRKTPEGWELTVKRMVRTGRVALSSEQAREVVRYLADHHGLAPAEAQPVFYLSEKRAQREEIPSDEIRETCVRCHLGARFMSQRRTAEEWKLLKGMHLGYFPVIESQSFRGDPAGDGENGAPEGEPLDRVWRVDRVLDDLARRFPLNSPEWKAFSAKRTSPDLSGRWMVVGHEPGVGLLTGELVMERSGGDYVTRATLMHPDGSVETREGRGVLYAGYSWRGRSGGEGPGETREVLMLSEAGDEMRGRAFWGTFGELGREMRWIRLGSDPRIAGVVPRALPQGAGNPGGARLRIAGANFPDSLEPSDIRLGPGVEVLSLSTRTPEAIELSVRVAADAPPGARNVGVGGVTAVDAFAIYDRVDYVQVRPEEGMARLGGITIPKQLVQFEAVGFHRGPDDRSLTADDVELGPLAASWSLEEYHGRPDDDDLRYVGEIDPRGLFTPHVEGPNPSRGGTNNFGDVWVIASFTPPGASLPVRGRARLLVTVPLYRYLDLFP